MNHSTVPGDDKALKHIRYYPTPDVIRRMLGHSDVRLNEDLKKEGIQDDAADRPNSMNRPFALTTRPVEITPEVVDFLRSMAESNASRQVRAMKRSWFQFLYRSQNRPARTGVSRLQDRVWRGGWAPTSRGQPQFSNSASCT